MNPEYSIWCEWCTNDLPHSAEQHEAAVIQHLTELDAEYDALREEADRQATDEAYGVYLDEDAYPDN